MKIITIYLFIIMILFLCVLKVIDDALCLVGFVPTTEIMRSASSAQKFYCRYILHGMLRFTKATRTVQQAANAIVSLALDEKFKGMSW